MRWAQLKAKISRWRLAHQLNERDAPADADVAMSRDTGGVDDSPGARATGDATSTTGVAENQEFVGRTAGDDLGYAGETGAEARAEADRQHRTEHD